jgi:hypothetical protein
MGKKNAEAYGKRNSTEGEVLVRINPTRIIANSMLCQKTTRSEREFFFSHIIELVGPALSKLYSVT